MRKRKADEIGPPADTHSGSQADARADQSASAQTMAAALGGQERINAAAVATTATATATSDSAAAVSPFSRLATVELQLIMRCCDQSTLIALARCSRFTLAAASRPFVWQPLSPVDVRCDWPLELSGRLRAEKSLLRHAQIGVTWRLLSAGAVSAEQVAALAALPRLSGVSVETAFDPSVNGHTRLSDEGAVLLFQALSERIDHGGTLASLRLIVNKIRQAGSAALAAFVEGSRTLTSLKITGASKITLTAVAAALVQCRTLTSLELHSAHSSTRIVRALTIIMQQSNSLATLKLNNFGQPLDDAAAAALAAAVAPSRSLTDLQLQDGEISDAGVEALAVALEQSGCILRLDLSRNSFGAAGAAALARLLASDQCALTSLDVSESEGIEFDGALALSKALQTNRTLTELRLGDISCGDEGIRVLLTALPHNPQCCLRVLDLSSNPLSASRASSLGGVIGRSLTLKRLELQSCRLGDEEMAALTAGIGRSRSLQHLDVSDNKFGAPGATALAAAVATCPALTWLDVGLNKIGDAGLAALAPALQLVRLRTLMLGSCGLTRSSAGPLAELIRRSRALEYLDIDGNGLETQGVSEIAAALRPSSSLRTLSLRSSFFGVTGADGTTALADALRRGWRASQLRLDWNRSIGDSGVRALASALERLGCSCTLTTLSLRESGVTAAGALALVRAATHTPSLQSLKFDFDGAETDSDRRALIAACGPHPHFELKLAPSFG